MDPSPQIMTQQTSNPNLKTGLLDRRICDKWTLVASDWEVPVSCVTYIGFWRETL